MPNFPSWSLTVTAGLRASAVARQLVTNYNLMESSLRQAMGAMPNIEAHRKAVQADGGSVASGFYSHFYLGGITASQHHDKHHGTTHITSVDPVPVASANGNGLMSSTLHAKLDTLATGNIKPIIVGWYVGGYASAALTSQYVNLGFTPAMLKIQHKESTMGMWEAYNGEPFAEYHSVSILGTSGGNPVKHKVVSGVHTVKIVTNGFKVYSTFCNKNVATYYFLAVGI